MWARILPFLIFTQLAAVGGEVEKTYDRLVAAEDLGTAAKELNALARLGEPAIPYLCLAGNINRFSDDFLWHLLDLLQEKCPTFPDAFSSIILNNTDPRVRKAAIFAVRKAGQDKCDKALTAVFNNAKESSRAEIARHDVPD